MPRTGIDGILFDLDETLYPRNAGLMQAIGRRIHQYIQERMGVSSELASKLRTEYYVQYGTSLRGLQVHYGIDPEDYLAFVHDVRLSDYIRPAPSLEAMLRAIHTRKAIFTNSTAEHAQKVTEILGIDNCFDQIIDVRSNRFIGKPHLTAYHKAANLLSVPPSKCMLVEDNVRNLRPGKQLGMVTVLVGNDESPDDAVDFRLTDVLGVKDVLERLKSTDP